jgi:hypothetical protein
VSAVASGQVEAGSVRQRRLKIGPGSRTAAEMAELPTIRYPENFSGEKPDIADGSW